MKSKLGIHTNAVTQFDQMTAFNREARPAVWKVIQDDPRFCERLKADDPRLLLIGREFWEPEGLVERPVEAAKAKFEAIRRRADWPYVDAYEGMNERDSYNWETFVAQAGFDYHLARYLHDAGKKYVALSWGTGHPPEYWLDQVFPWRNFLEHYAAVFRVADYLGVHEYGWPGMFSPGMLGWHVGRWQNWHDRLPTDLKKPVIITECGWDSGVANIRPSKGWRENATPRQYLADLEKYDWLLQRRPEVVGATIYCWGTHDPAWDSFDLSGEMAELLRDYMIAQEEDMALPDWIRDIRPQVAFSGPKRQRMRGICVHHAGSKANLEALLDFLKREMMVSYHVVIGAKGETVMLNNLDEKVAHAGDGWPNGPWNAEGVAVCFEGLLTGQGEPTKSQFTSFRKLRAWLLTQGVGEEIVPHKAVRVPQWSTQCPGDWWPKEGAVPRALLEDTGMGELERLRMENAALRSKLTYAKMNARAIVEYLEREDQGGFPRHA